MAARDERLLVGRRDDLARAQRGQHRPQADDAAGGHDHEVDIVAGREAGQGVRIPVQRHARGRVQVRHRGRIRECGDQWSAGGHLGGERLDVTAGGQADDPEGLGTGPEQHIQRLAADGAGRTQQGDPDRVGRLPGGRRH